MEYLLYLQHRQAANGNMIRPEDIVITGTMDTVNGLEVEFYVRRSSGGVMPGNAVASGVQVSPAILQQIVCGLWK